MSSFPVRFQEISRWSRENAVPLDEARRRFAQFVILAAIVSNRSLRESLVFKGGNALDLVWQPNRSTLDLDFSIDHAVVAFEIGVASIRRSFERSVSAVQQRFSVRLRVQSVRQLPPGSNRTFPTFAVRIGYALPDEMALLRRMDDGRPSPHVIDVEISVNEPLGSVTTTLLDSSLPPLRVGTVEDIVAEKLRALLQQPIRNRERRQDLLDIAVLLRLHPGIDRDAVGRFLVLKSKARGIDARRSAFAAPEIRRRASVDYDRLRETTRVLFIPFEEAWALLIDFVHSLPIPD
jgi:predicted nucleotidyltransferase component of viral defense system